MHKICIILAYFGPLPEWFNLWLLSCHYNPTISFLIVTDQLVTIPEGYDNVHILPMTLSQMKDMADKKLGMNTALVYPYKCCDLRPAYGVIFEDFLKGYDFWGHCDCDLIFGDLRKFFTEDRLCDYDRIFGQGHVSIYRNTAKCNRYYELSPDYKRVFTTSSNFGFDENLSSISIGRVLCRNHIPVFYSRAFADIGTIHKRFLCTTDKNANRQIFYWNKGKVYRDYENQFFNIQERDEFAYIHFQKRKLKNCISADRISGVTSFVVSYMGFFPISDTGFDDLVNKYNPYPGRLHEYIEKLRWDMHHPKLRMLRKIYHKLKG